jgi:signal transduction histidine kinase
MRTHLNSIRWRLPLSYIGVALLAALASGVLMLVTLRGYYRQRELNYLQTNARQIGRVAQQLLQAHAPEFVLADQIVNWSFLLQVRVQVRGADGQTLADSGPPDSRQVMMVSGNPPGVDLADTESITDTFTIPIPRGLPGPGMFFLSGEKLEEVGGDVLFSRECQPEADVVPAECEALPTIIQYATTGPARGVISFTQAITEPIGPIGVAMPLAGSLYGFELEAPTEITARSTEQIEQPIVNAEGQPLGAVVLSDGPAYGREILLSALVAWAAASLIAILLAGAAGIWVSRCLTAPLLALIQVTESMASGNLTARAPVNIANEFGQLGHSFNAMAERVTHTIHTLSQFVADAAHELNTPLTALQTNVELALTSDDSLRGDLLVRAQAQIERLQDLVTGLLNLSRLESQNSTPHPEALDLATLVRSISELYASRAEQAGLIFELELPAEPLLTQGDPAQLRRVLENLLDNAIKFTKQGTVKLEVKRIDDFGLQITDFSNEQSTISNQQSAILISVSDTGIGIPPEDRPLLFQRFHRGRNAAAYPGNGLGLAIVQAIVEAHGGVVTMNATEGGTSFIVALPGSE